MPETDFTQILELLKRRANRPLSLKEIQRQLDLDAGERKNLGRLLKTLVRDGSLVHLKGGRYALPDKVNLVVGTLSLHRDGYGFVASGDGRDKDIFIPARHVRPAMHGDQVVVRLERGLRTGRPEGRVIRVERRAHKQVVGRYELSHGVGYVHAADPRQQDDVLIQPGEDGGAHPGDMVVARIDSYPGRNRAAIGVVTEVLGDPSDPEVEIKVAAVRFGLPHEFSAKALEEAQQVPQSVGVEELRGREDLRAVSFVTIDGETAKDFDDAVAVENRPDGGCRLRVAIADVAHYVRPGSAIDRDALVRGTSVYFPGSCLPMLPEALSNGICSLNPGVDRLVLVADLDFDRDGRRSSARFYPAVIRSRARLTYTEVAALLAGNAGETLAESPELAADLRQMAELARLRTARRRERGSLDLDLPEAEIHLDLRGRPENIVRAERNAAHGLIEEFMLAANEAVADWLTRHKSPVIYRVHEQPSEGKMIAFQQFIAFFNQGIVLPPEGVRPTTLQQLLARVAGRPEERVINHVLLRSLPQAYYSAENRGHFGLASSCYCHFTSPIRRYPDLAVHRLLRKALGHDAAGEGDLPEIAQRCSVNERRAMEAERDIVDLKKCQFMVDKVGETFHGIVTSVQAFGFFVELREFFVEGLVHVSSLEDDFYQFDEERHQLLGMNRRRLFEIGTDVEVNVHKVDLERREIDFRLVEKSPRTGGGEAGPGKRRSRRRRA